MDMRSFDAHDSAGGAVLCTWLLMCASQYPHDPKHAGQYRKSILGCVLSVIPHVAQTWNGLSRSWIFFAWWCIRRLPVLAICTMSLPKNSRKFMTDARIVNFVIQFPVMNISA